MPHLQEHISSLGRAKELEFVRKHDSAHAELCTSTIVVYILEPSRTITSWRFTGTSVPLDKISVPSSTTAACASRCGTSSRRRTGGGPTIVSDNTMDLKTAKVLPSNAADEELQELAEEERYRRLNSRSSDRSSRQSSMNEKRSSQSNEQSSLRSTSTASFQLRTGSRSSSICSQAVDEDAEAEAAEAEAAEPPAPAEPPSETRKGG
eukprot:6466817-Amphidinium_carterae.1